jgi:ketosteroid isomerase-like protein
VLTNTVRELLSSAYAAFNTRDIDGALSAMQPDVAWANGMEGGIVHGSEGVRAYWTRQWQMIECVTGSLLEWRSQTDERWSRKLLVICRPTTI